MIAIAADNIEETKTFADSLAPWFLLAADPQMEQIRAWGVADPRGPYARPATFVVKKGDIVWRYLGKNKKDRPAIDDVLNALRNK